VYWENMPRATWEIRPQETNDQSLLKVGLFPRKQNMARPPAVGLRLSFQPDAITVEPVAVDDVTTAQGATQSMILGELERGPVSIKELVEATGADSNVVRVLLTKLRKRGVVDIQSRGVWCLSGEAGQ
jgi:hypothetical protein